MKLRSRTKLPEQRLRRTVEAAGGVMEMRLSALLRPHGVKTPSADAVATLEQSLTEAGLTVSPPLAGCAWDDVISVAVTNGHAPDAEAPVEEPEVAVEQNGTHEQEVPGGPEAAHAVEEVEQV